MGFEQRFSNNFLYFYWRFWICNFKAWLVKLWSSFKELLLLFLPFLAFWKVILYLFWNKILRSKRLLLNQRIWELKLKVFRLYLMTLRWLCWICLRIDSIWLIWSLLEILSLRSWGFGLNCKQIFHKIICILFCV